MPEFSEVYMDRQAKITVPNGYTGTVFNIGGGIEGYKANYNISFVHIEGGWITENPSSPPIIAQQKWIAFQISGRCWGSVDNTVQKTYVVYPGTAIFFNGTGTTPNTPECSHPQPGINGTWANHNTFRDLYIHNPLRAISFNFTGTFKAYLNGFNRNQFENIFVETAYHGDSATNNTSVCINNIEHITEEFSNVNCIDLGGNERSAIISSTAQDTTIFGGVVTNKNFVDNGTNTRIIDGFKGIKGPQVNATTQVITPLITNVTTIKQKPNTYISITSPSGAQGLYLYPAKNSNTSSISFWDCCNTERLYIQKIGYGSYKSYNFSSSKETSSGALRDIIFQFHDTVTGITNSALSMSASDFSVKIGKLLNLQSNRIVNVGTPTTSTDAQNANHLGLLGNMTYGSKCANSQILKWQASNSTWVCANNLPSTHFLVGQWDTEKTFSNIGTSFVDVYTTPNSIGHAIQIDTNGYTQVLYQVIWSKPRADTGTETCQMVDPTNSANVIITTSSLSNGTNTGSDTSVPAGLSNTIHNYKWQCKSTTGADNPLWLGGRVWLKP